MIRIIIAAAVLVVTVSTAHAQTRPADQVAAEILQGFAAQDITPFQRHGSPRIADLVQGIVDGTRPAADLFGTSRATIAAGWDGHTLPARYERQTANVPFAIDTDSGAVSVTVTTGAEGAEGAEGVYHTIQLTLAADGVTWQYASLTRIVQAGYARRAPDPF